MLRGEPEYRRRARHKAAENQEKSHREQDKTAENANIERQIAAIERVVEKLDGAQDENAPKNKSERRWRKAEVLGLWAAAAVGVGAIWYGNHDAELQRDVMKGQLTAMRSQVVEMIKVYGPIKDQADAAQKANRAWLGAVDARIEGPVGPDGITPTNVSTGNSFRVTVLYRNSGREPAKNVVNLDPIAQTYNAAEWGRNGAGPAKVEIIDIQKQCISAHHTDGNVVFPSEQATEIVVDFIAPAHALPPDIIDGSSTIVILYCLQYYTEGTPHHTAFGFFYQRGTPPERLRIVQYGNDAD